MSNNNFDKAFDLVVGVEGGYVNDPRDPGGRTIYGITERDNQDLWRAGPPTLAQAKARYKRDYWDAPENRRRRHRWQARTEDAGRSARAVARWPGAVLG